jgi:hypothetical protein
VGELRIKRTSGGSLQRRIAEGKADPISDRERAQLQEIRAIYVRRFGKDPDGRTIAKTA